MLTLQGKERKKRDRRKTEGQRGLKKGEEMQRELVSYYHSDKKAGKSRP